VSLSLQYNYNPNQGYAPIHIGEGSNELIKHFYSKLWFGQDFPEMAEWTLHGAFRASKTIQRNDIEKFCAAIKKPVLDTTGSRFVEKPFSCSVFEG
jgi:enoyl reductase-like protein